MTSPDNQRGQALNPSWERSTFANTAQSRWSGENTMSAKQSNGDRPSSSKTVPVRLHHSAYVCRDLEQTRKFYEDILGWPLVATWRECDKVFGEDELYYCHLFFQIADGGALAFFHFANPKQHEKFAHYGPHSPFVHLALKVSDAAGQQEMQRRLEAGGHATLVVHPRQR